MSLNVAVVGATGAVGEAIIDGLHKRGFPIDNCYALASSRSAGNTVMYGNKQLTVIDCDEFDFSTCDVAFFSAGKAVSEVKVLQAVEAGCWVIDNTSQFRYQDDVPLIIPEVNKDYLQDKGCAQIIANPNCSTIQMLVALAPIYRAVGISRINVATYQAVSGAGRSGVSELAEQTSDLLSGKSTEPNVFSAPIAFNVIPHIDSFEANGYTREEMKMVWETRKILCDPDIMVNPTAVRVPVFYGHSEAVNIETVEPIDVAAVYQLLEMAAGVEVLRDGHYPTPMEQGANQDSVWVGRIRKDISHERGMNMWVVADNVRKGAATNAIQIAEHLLEMGILKNTGSRVAT